MKRIAAAAWRARLALAAAGLASLPAQAAEPTVEPAAAEAASSPERRRLEAFLLRLRTDVPRLLGELHVPGAAVAVIEDGRIVFSRGFGFADSAGRRPVSPDTAFSVQSVSKLLTAWTVMSLVEEGRLALDEPVERRLTRWRLPDSTFERDGVTVRRLLSHTAGLASFPYRGWRPGQRLPTLEQSLSGDNNGGGPLHLVAEPGSRWAYSNGGYALLQLLVEESTGRRFEDVARERALVPLGMTSSSFDPPAGRMIARAYDETGEETPSPRLREVAAGGLHASLADLTRFALAHMRAPGREPGRGVLRPATLDLMLSAAPGTEGNQGLGYMLLEGDNAFPDGRARAGHDGRNRGWSSFFWFGRGSRDALIVLTNSSYGWNVSNQILAGWQAAKSGRERPIRRSIAASILAELRRGGPAAAERRYYELKATRHGDFIWGEGELNELGYALLHRGRASPAAAIFELNAREFPESWNAFDSLGDAYAAAGDPISSRRAFERSLALNPDNANARDRLRRLPAAPVAEPGD